MLLFSSLGSKHNTLFFSAFGIFLGGLTTGLAFLSKLILYFVGKQPSPSKTSLFLSRISSDVVVLLLKFKPYSLQI